MVLLARIGLGGLGVFFGFIGIFGIGGFGGLVYVGGFVVCRCTILGFFVVRGIILLIGQHL